MDYSCTHKIIKNSCVFENIVIFTIIFMDDNKKLRAFLNMIVDRSQVGKVSDSDTVGSPLLILLILLLLLQYRGALNLLVQFWTLISRHIRNVSEKFFSANVPKVIIFGLLVRTGTINDFSYQDSILTCFRPTTI